MLDRDILIRKADSADLDAIKQLADNNTSTLGFVLRPSLIAGIEMRWLILAEISSEVVGFVHYRHRRDSQTTLYEICVAQGHRRKGIGKTLISVLIAESSARGKTHIRLKAPVDIQANDFYRAIGFTLMGMESGRNRSLNIWTYTLSALEGMI